LTETQKAIRVIAVSVVALSFYTLVHSWLVVRDQRLTMMSGILVVVNWVIAAGLWEFKNWARIWTLIRFAVTGFRLAQRPTLSNFAMIAFFLVAGYYLCRSEVIKEFESRQ
jgi:hypothetical protein